MNTYKLNIINFFKGTFISSVSLSLLARAIGIINIILILPLIVNNYTAEEFTVFTIFTQFITIYGFLDLGIGNILINEIVYYRNKEYFKILRTVVFQILKFLSVLSLIFIVLATLLYFIFGIEVIFSKLNDDLLNAINSNYFQLTILFFLILPTTLIQKIQFGFLDNSIFHLSEVIQKSSQIIVIYLLVKYKYSIIDLIFYYYLVILVTNSINMLYYFLIIKKDIFKKYGIVKKTYIPSLIKKSVYFFLGSIFFFFSRTLDTYLISFYGSFEYLKDFEIIKRPFDIGLTTVMIITSVLWPMLAEANHKKEFKKIKKLLSLTFLGVLIVMIIVMILMTFFGDFILQTWINDDSINYTKKMYILVGVIFLIYALGNILVTYLNSISIFRVQLVTYVILAVVGIPVKIYVLVNYSLEQYFIALIVLLLLIYIVPMYLISAKKLKQLNS